MKVKSLLMNDHNEKQSNSQQAIEAAVFRHLVGFLRTRTDVQNIDLMNLAGFCRNCLAKWYRAEAEKQGVTISDPEARERIYGMAYDEWKKRYKR